MATLKGNSSANTLNGTSSADYIYGYGGNDTLNGNGGNDHLYGGDGSDKLDGGLGVDWLYGEGGNDTIYFGGYADNYDGGSGTDTLSFAKKTSGWTLIETYSGPGDPNTTGVVAGFEKIVGSSYADNFQIDQSFPNGNTITSLSGGGGNDTLVVVAMGEGVTTKIYGGSGNDTIGFTGQYGAGGFGLVGHGNSGNDHLHVDDMTGGTGADTFALDAFAPDPDPFGTNAGAIVRDFHHSEADHLLFETDGNSSTLTNSGDIWTVHNTEGDFSFEIAGITHLDTSDYSFG